MQFALRDQFIQRTLEPTDLFITANLWRHWFLLAQHQANGNRPSAPEASFQWEVRFWGFARERAEAFREEIARQASGIHGATAALFDPDTVALTSPSVPIVTVSADGMMALFPPLPDPTPYLLLATTPLCNDLCISIRLRIHSTPGKGGARVHGNTLVFFGGTQDERFILRCCWPAGPQEEEEQMFVYARWPHELQWMQCLFDAAQQGVEHSVLPHWAQTLFPVPSTQSVGRAVMWFLNPGGKRKLGALALRLLLSGAVIALCLLVFARVSRPSVAVTTLFGPVLLVALLGFGFLLFWAFYAVTQTHKRMSAEMTRLYRAPLHHTEVDIAQRPDIVRDPGLRKFSADLESSGGQHYCDVRLEQLSNGEFTIRLFLFPDISTVFAASLMHGIAVGRLFPAKPSFLVKTYFTDGTYLVSTNGHSGYRKPIPENPGIARVFSDEMDPGTMLRKHRAALEQIVTSGKQIAPLNPERIIPLMEEEHEKMGALMAKYGYYSWEAAFRQAFDLVRPEYR